MDLKQLARSLGVTQQPAINRATELLRLLKLKVPGSLGQGEICRPAVCLELACQTTPGSKLPLREEFIRYSCSAPKVYNEMFTRIQRLLDVRPALELRELVTLFGCSQLHDGTQQLLRTYKSRFLEALTDAERARADLSRPALLAAAFLLTAKKARARVDRAALLVKMGLTRAELATALEDVAARCEDQLTAAPGGSRKRGKDSEGQTGAADDNAAEQSEPGPSGTRGGGGGGGSGTAAVHGGTKRRRGAAAPSREAEAGGRGPGHDAEAAAVDDFKLVLIGLAPSGGPAAAEGGDDCEAAAEAVRPRRKAAALARARKGGKGGGEEAGPPAAEAAEAVCDDGGGDSDGAHGARRQRRRV